MTKLAKITLMFVVFVDLIGQGLVFPDHQYPDHGSENRVPAGVPRPWACGTSTTGW